MHIITSVREERGWHGGAGRQGDADEEGWSKRERNWRRGRTTHVNEEERGEGANDVLGIADHLTWREDNSHQIGGQASGLGVASSLELGRWGMGCVGVCCLAG